MLRASRPLIAAVVAACSAGPAGAPAHDDAGGVSPTPAVPSPATPDATPEDAASPQGPQGFPPHWDDGTACPTTDLQTWRYDASTVFFRQSLCTHFEAPFLYLFVGAQKALLVDTGTGDANVRAAVDAALAGHDVDLVVAHSHAHGDHVGGDAAFAGRPRTTVIGKTPAAVTSAFAIANMHGTIDLGGRVLDVIAIPGHEPSHVAFYDRKTRLLLSGDTLYPGRLYVRDWNAYRASVARLVAFVDDGHPVSHVLGAHIELSKSGAEIPQGAKTHPNEHVLQLGEAELRDLAATVGSLTTPQRVERPGYVIVPL